MEFFSNISLSPIKDFVKAKLDLKELKDFCDYETRLLKFFYVSVPFSQLDNQTALRYQYKPLMVAILTFLLGLKCPHHYSDSRSRFAG